MQVVALMIGRGGSTLRDKNILPVLGVPLLLWAAGAARRSKYISRFYVSSDDNSILETAGLAGYKPIRRPNELAHASSQSCDAVRHAFPVMEKDGDVDIVVVQHANVGTITESMIDDCIEILIRNEESTSVVPAHEKSEYHPFRAKMVLPNGSLEAFFDSSNNEVSANRQDLPQCVFFDHSFWVLRGRRAIFDAEGQRPWNCMGSHIIPYLTNGCLDVHDLDDLQKTSEWILKNNVSPPGFINKIEY